MILLTHQTKILLGTAPADFRAGIDGFVALCQNKLSLNPRDQSVFVFINRAKTMIRALSYDGTGYWLLTKRISRGKFHGWPTANAPVSEATALQLRRILGGSDWQSHQTVPSPQLASASPCTTLTCKSAVSGTA